MLSNAIDHASNTSIWFAGVIDAYRVLIACASTDNSDYSGGGSFHAGPEAWLLPAESDPRDKQISALKAQIAEHKRSHASVEIRFPGSDEHH